MDSYSKLLKELSVVTPVVIQNQTGRAGTKMHMWDKTRIIMEVHGGEAPLTDCDQGVWQQEADVEEKEVHEDVLSREV